MNKLIMFDKKLFFSGILMGIFFVSILLMGFGISGKVVSKTCNFMADSGADNVCDNVRADLANTNDRMDTFVGFALFISTLLAYTLMINGEN